MSNSCCANRRLHPREGHKPRLNEMGSWNGASYRWQLNEKVFWIAHAPGKSTEFKYSCGLTVLTSAQATLGLKIPAEYCL